MTKKDYERAAKIAQETEVLEGNEPWAVQQAFVALFKADGNPRFDEARFRRACVPGANVKARN